MARMALEISCLLTFPKPLILLTMICWWEKCIVFQSLWFCKPWLVDEKVGVKDIAFHWFYSYLSNRTQVVKINKYFKFTSSVKLWPPQWSVLGPIMFLIYCNDLGQGRFISDLNTFADDKALTYIGPSKSDLFDTYLFIWYNALTIINLILTVWL